jgi:prepilin-type N-terminal cleavage/methylation domain-containing protein
VTDRRCDRGFTLVELLIVIGIVGLLAASLAAIFTIFVRTTPSNEARADDARSLLGISTWLPTDVSNTPVMPAASATTNWDDAPGRISGCAGTDPGTNIVRLAWREQISGSPQNFIAAYRLLDEGETSRVVRLTCSPGGTPTVSRTTAGLPAVGDDPIDLIWKKANDPVTGVEYIVGLELEITTIEGDTLRVDATSRNPNQALGTVPPAVTSSSTAAPTTAPPTTAPPTTAPPGGNAPPVGVVPFTYMSSVHDEVVTFTMAGLYDPNGDLLNITFSNPGPWGISAAFNDTTGWYEATITVPPQCGSETDPYCHGTFPLTYTVTEVSANPNAPLSSTFTLIFTHDTASTTTTTTPSPFTTTTTTTVPPPPNQAPTAAPVTYTGQRDLAIDLTLPASDPDGDPLTATFGALPDGWTVSASGIEVTFPASNKGTNQYTIQYTVTDPGGATASSTITIILTPVPCTARFDSVNPNPAAYNASSGHLIGALTVSITNWTGDCTANLTLRFKPKPTDAFKTEVFGASLVLTIGGNDFKWSGGAHTLELVIPASLGVPTESVIDTETLTIGT